MFPLLSSNSIFMFQNRGSNLIHNDSADAGLTTIRSSDPTKTRFSLIGRIDPQTLAKKMNPFHALFNCPVVAVKTAALLENGVLPSNKELGLFLPNRPRPMYLTDVLKTWPQFFGKGNRGYFVMEGFNRKSLETVMTELGKGTHAMVGGSTKRMGHVWNYVLDGNELRIIDRYSKRHHRLGENPDAYFSHYNETLSEAVVFYEKTAKNVDYVNTLTKSISRIFKKAGS